MLIGGGWIQAQNFGNLTIKITQIERPGEGQIVFMLFNQKEGFPEDLQKALYKGRVREFDSEASYTFKSVPFGSYAVAVFQDKNQNDFLDANFVGAPQEPLGTSNMKMARRPSFRKCAFEFKAKQKTLEIQLVSD